ncbi:(2Fe-2S) ferredoxin domain-containing protein [Daejeonella sp. JGW-45]|uniref:(2Fe-2S) ferredoxin domain-containing protein n=1 Tax=Daejeonella sp. JGW-45 TaxID=3034148 RepID=UPI0023EDF248|nr:(2Fe-2S) ferredoxin domain-containing protein [Daejeonella sp. JGW-45]
MGSIENNKHIFYQCDGANCKKKKGKILQNYLKKYRLIDRVDIEKMDCSDRCKNAPVLHLHPDDLWFSEKDLGNVIKKYILSNNNKEL